VRASKSQILPARGLGAALAAAAFLVGSCAPSGSGTSAADGNAGAKTAEDAGSGAAPAAPSSPAVSLGDLPAAVGRLEALRQEVEGALVVDDEEKATASGLEATLRRMTRFRERVDGLPYDELLEVSRRVATTDRWVSSTAKVVSSRLGRVERDGHRVTELRGTFDSLAELAGRTNAPPEIRLRAGICRSELDEFAAKLAARRDEILVLVGKLAEVSGNVASLKAGLEANLETVRRGRASGSAEPIWNVRVTGKDVVSATAERLARDFRRVGLWAERQSTQLAVVAVLVLGGTILLLRRLRPGVARRAETDPAALATLRIMESPIAAAIPVTLLAVLIFSPTAPAFVYDLALVPSAPAAAWVIVKMLGRRVARTVWLLAAVLAFEPARSVLGGLPLTDRLALALQTAPLAVALALDLRGGRFEGLVPGRTGSLLRAAAWLLAGCLALAAVGSLVGWVGLAEVLSQGALGTLGGVFLVLASYLVLEGLLHAVLSSRPAQGLRIVRNHAEKVGGTLLRGLRVVAGLLVILIGLTSFELLRPLVKVLSGMTSARLAVGSLTVSGGAIVAFVVVFAATIALSRLLGFLLSEEVLPRFDLGRGAAFAVSMMTRYLVLVAGFTMAAGAAGIDLSQVGFLAGALGVGIGFGLQNVVNNFVSGLILLFERPVQVGDAVEVTGASGSVTRIGIRASVVRTFDGAEVIVPNADLISKPVTNWTLSDPHRRFDVAVGVAYGSPLETTAQALLAAARRTKGLLPAPGPEAFFQSFGDSALVWTLRIWVRMDESPQVLSELKRCMSEELAKAGLEVPFPQRDLHIRSVAPEARLAPDGRGDPSTA
jgi:potassium-dependent mechanosensitive channel